MRTTTFDFRSSGEYLTATAAVCFGLLVYEILSTRILSVVLEGHLITFAIAFAMLGMGAATSFMSFGSSPKAYRLTAASLGPIAMALGLSYLLSLFLLTMTNDYASAALESAMDRGGLGALIESIRATIMNKLLWVGAILFVPYFIFGLFIATLFRSSAKSEYHKFYAADLIGASIGCILAVVSLDYFGFAGGLTLIMVSTFSGAALFSRSKSRYIAVVSLGLAVSALVAFTSPATVNYFEPRPSINQLARNYDKTYDVNEEWHISNAHSRIAFLSMKHRQTGKIRTVYAHENGAGWANVPNQIPYPEGALTTMYNPKRVLVLFAGVGADMIDIDRRCAGTCEITGVEINRHMVDHALSRGYPQLKQFAARPGINFRVAEAREYLERDQSKYDTILLSWWGAGTSHYVGTSGKLAQYLYTQEAFRSLIDHLTPEGILVLYNGSKAQALYNFRQVIQDGGLNRQQNWAVVVKKDFPALPLSNKAGLFDLLETTQLIIKPSGFSDDELEIVAGVVEDMGSEIVLTPDAVDPRYAIYRDIADGIDPDAVNKRLRDGWNAELSAVTDDRPFFNELLPRSNYLDMEKWLDTENKSALWGITRIFFVFTLLLSLVAVLLIMAPLMVRSGPDLSRKNFLRLTYFLCLGAGFILIEIGLVRKLGLILGHPSYSISIVLASLIFSTGVGSLFSERLYRTGILDARRTALMIIAYLAVGTFLYEALVTNLIALSIVSKAAIVVLSLFPLGFLMGQLFPQGLVEAGGADSRLVPWAWAINGTASTISVGLAYLLSYPLGFNMLLFLGAVFYAGVAVLPLKRLNPQYAPDAVPALT